MYPIAEFLEYTKKYSETEYPEIEFSIKGFRIEVNILFYYLESADFNKFVEHMNSLLKYVTTVKEISENYKKGSVTIFPSHQDESTIVDPDDDHIFQRFVDHSIYGDILEDVENYSVFSYNVELIIEM